MNLYQHKITALSECNCCRRAMFLLRQIKPASSGRVVAGRHKIVRFAKIVLFILVNMASSVTLIARQPGISIWSTVKKLDGLNRKEACNNCNDNDFDQTALKPLDYFVLLGSNIKQEVTRPFQLKKRDWIKLAAFGAIAVSVGFVDEPIQKNALKLRAGSRFIRSAGSYISKSGGRNEILSLAAIEVFGLITKNKKIKTTVLLASQAFLAGGLFETAIKTLTGRTRPNFYNSSTEPEPRFTGFPGNTVTNAAGEKFNSSFPSGHATAAFAVATVFATRYKNIPAIPVAAYTIATLISISRVTENKHWASDVFAGAALGYITGRQATCNYHRLLGIRKQYKKNNKSISFNLQYNQWGKLLPGIVYTW